MGGRIASTAPKCKDSLRTNFMGGGSTVQDVNGAKFSTMDRDNDQTTRDCANEFKGGWWWKTRCHTWNLNRIYCSEAWGEGLCSEAWGKGISWDYWESMT